MIPLKKPLTREKLQSLLKETKYKPSDNENGPSNAYSKLRLFGKKESDVRVILFRDHHAWCPYC